MPTTAALTKGRGTAVGIVIRLAQGGALACSMCLSHLDCEAMASAGAGDQAHLEVYRSNSSSCCRT